MTYPGNPALSPEIQQRILDTFAQTVELAERGSSQEAILGCDFILRLDPSFEPARVLRGRLEGAGDQPIDVDDIKAAVPDIFEEGEPEPLVPVSEDAAAPDESEMQPEPREEDPVKAEILQAYENRDFQRTLSLISDHQAQFSGDTEIRTIRSEASSRLEAEPYVKNFIQQARVALQDGERAKATEWLEKARSLDPSHPELEEMETVQGFYDDPELRMGYRRHAGDAAQEESAAATAEEEGEETESDESVSAASEVAEAPTSESAQRIAELLAEGQVAFDDKDYQGAIDVWSRIFLIDIDHAEATRRIEEARQLKAEGEREIEEIYHEGLSCAEHGDVAGARVAFQKVLELQPQHVAARDQLKLLESAKAAAPKPIPQVAAQPEEEIPDEYPATGETLYSAEQAPAPGVPQQRAPSVTAARPAKRPMGGRAFIWIGGFVLLVVVVAGWLLYSRRQNIFPNAKTAAAQKQKASSGPIGRAKRLQAAGKVDLAIRLLQGILPDNPDYAQAQTLIAQWQTPAAGEASAQDLAGREDLIAQARRAHEQGDDLSAGKLIDHAAAIAPLVGDAAKLADSIHEKLAPVEKELELFQNNDWEYALPDLWRMHEANPQERVVNQLLVNGYYNLAVRDLQRNSPENALEKVQEALNLAPHDEHLQRVKAFAETYEHQPRDLRYRLFVKYLPFR